MSKNRREKQLGIKVVRFDKKKPTWCVKISMPKDEHLQFNVMLPGEWPRYWMAKKVAEMLALMYRTGAGYEVTLDTTSCRKRQKPFINTTQIGSNFIKGRVSG